MREPASRATRRIRPRHPAEQRHAQHRAARGDGDVGHDGVAAGPEVLDTGNEGNIELALGQQVGEPAGHFENQFRFGGQMLPGRR